MCCCVELLSAKFTGKWFHSPLCCCTATMQTPIALWQLQPAWGATPPSWAANQATRHLLACMVAENMREQQVAMQAPHIPAAAAAAVGCHRQLTSICATDRQNVRAACPGGKSRPSLYQNGPIQGAWHGASQRVNNTKQHRRHGSRPMVLNLRLASLIRTGKASGSSWWGCPRACTCTMWLRHQHCAEI